MTQVVWEGKWLLIISTIIFTGVFFVYLQRPLLAVPIKLNFDIEALCRGRLQRGTISTLRKSIETLTDFVISSVVQVTSSSGIPSDMIKEIDHTTELTTEEAKITTTTLTTTTLTTPSTTMTSTTTPPFDIHPGTIITTIKSQSSLSSSNVWCPQCKPALHALVDKYFEPHRNGITKDIIDDAFYVKIYVTPQDSMALIQVINSTIYADLRRMDHYPWNRSRLRFIVSRLQEFLDQRRKYCEKNHFPADECQPNFEFVVDVVDCQNNWPHPGTVRYGNRTEGESRIRQDSFPIFAMTKCKDRNSIPAPQWHIDRDGAFEDYDKNTKKFLEDAYCEKPDEREP